VVKAELLYSVRCAGATYAWDAPKSCRMAAMIAYANPSCGNAWQSSVLEIQTKNSIYWWENSGAENEHITTAFDNYSDYACKLQLWTK